MNLRRNEANGPEWGGKKQEHQFQNHWLFWADVLENGRDFSDDWISIDKYFLNLFEWRDLFSQFSSLNVYCFLDRLFSSRICHGRLEIAGPVALFFFFTAHSYSPGKCFPSLLRREALVYNVLRVWRYSNSVVGDCSITISIQLVVTLVAFTQRGIIIVSFLRFDRNPRERNVIFCCSSSSDVGRRRRRRIPIPRNGRWICLLLLLLFLISYFILDESHKQHWIYYNRCFFVFFSFASRWLTVPRTRWWSWRWIYWLPTGRTCSTKFSWWIDSHTPTFSGMLEDSLL